MTLQFTCFSNNSLLGVRQVTRCLVSRRNEPNTSNVKWSLDDLCNI